MPNFSSRGSARRLNPLGYGFSSSGSMVLGPSVRTIMLPYLDTPRALLLQFDVVPHARAHLALELPWLGHETGLPLVTSAAGLLNPHQQDISQLMLQKV